MFLSGKEQPLGRELTVQLPKRLRMKADLDMGGQKFSLILVVNDDKGWQSAGGAADALGKERLAEVQEDIYFLWVTGLVPLKKDPAFDLAPLPDIQFENQPAAGVLVTHKGHPDVKLYFDKKTHLLVRAVRSVPEAGQQVEKEVLCTGYKEFDGAKLPAKLIETHNGRKFSETTITGYKFLQGADESAFAKP